MQLKLALVLGLVYAVNARDCLNPTPMVNLDMAKFANDWYEVAIHSPNNTDIEGEKGVKCNHVNYKVHDDDFDIVVKYIYEGTESSEPGKYKSLEKPKAMFSLNFPDYVEYNKFIFKIMCTDYNNWAVIYSSAPFEPGHCSEYTIILSRDRSKLGELKNNDEMKQCLQKNMQVSVDNLIAIDQHDCSLMIECF